jgi:hypothetical protein
MPSTEPSVPHSAAAKLGHGPKWPAVGSGASIDQRGWAMEESLEEESTEQSREQSQDHLKAEELATIKKLTLAEMIEKAKDKAKAAPYGPLNRWEMMSWEIQKDFGDGKPIGPVSPSCSIDRRGWAMDGFLYKGCI